MEKYGKISCSRRHWGNTEWAATARLGCIGLGNIILPNDHTEILFTLLTYSVISPLRVSVIRRYIPYKHCDIMTVLLITTLREN